MSLKQRYLAQIHSHSLIYSITFAKPPGRGGGGISQNGDTVTRCPAAQPSISAPHKMKAAGPIHGCSSRIAESEHTHRDLLRSAAAIGPCADARAAAREALR